MVKIPLKKERMTEKEEKICFRHPREMICFQAYNYIKTIFMPEFILITI